MTNGNIYTIPDEKRIKFLCGGIPEDMHPSAVPYAIVGEGVLSEGLCDQLIKELDKLEPYRHQGCDAVTRALAPVPQSFAPICEFTRQANLASWRFAINNFPRAWYQTYRDGEGYQLHTDGMLGQTRKLTTVVMLSDPLDYTGGELRLVPHPEYAIVPNVRGTMVTFPSWMLHEVLPVHHGLRRTINLGYWGPPFK